MKTLYQEEKTKAFSAWHCFAQSQTKDTQRILLLANAYWQKLHLDKAQIESLANLLKGEATKLPFQNKENRTILNICLAPTIGQDNVYNKILAIAISMVMANLKVPIVLKGDRGYGFEIGLSDIIAELSLSIRQSADQMTEDLDNFNFTYIHLPQLYTSLQDWNIVREDFGQKSIIDQVLPILPVLENGDNIYNLVACADLQQTRFYAQFLNFEKGHGAKTALLHDNSNTAFLSLCSDFYWQTSSDIEVMYLKDWHLPQLENNCLQQAEKIENAAQAAQIVKQLLKGEKGQDWQTILLVNVAFLLQTISPKGDIMRALFDAEAALESQRAYQLLEMLEAKNKKDI